MPATNLSGTNLDAEGARRVSARDGANQRPGFVETLIAGMARSYKRRPIEIDQLQPQPPPLPPSAPRAASRASYTWFM
jgi:hypothetical protein